MLNLLGTLSLWLIAGFLLGVASVFATGHIPFFLPGLILGGSGGVIHLVANSIKPQGCSWWLSGILIMVLSITATAIFIPDTRAWVIARILLIYYFFFGALFYFAFNKLLASENSIT